ncbi:MAG TPA: GIY-YIG nuclease family protein [Candidatus Baltobacteraceae bacterium]|nr:GIY-YIG nuclease family protein [Candidatus Baltobacteraceae bacterium]
MQNSYFVYMVLCDDGSYYTGVTRDADRRAAQHNEGIDPRCYTFTRRPVRLVYSSQFNDVNEAIRFEKQLKGWSRKKKQALVRGDWDAIVTLAREIRPLKR